MQHEIVLHNPLLDDAYILLEPQVVETLRAHYQQHADAPEAGGILIGYRRGSHLHIVEATAPTENDSRSRFSFSRNCASHSDRARTLWNQSGGILDYVGEWHTHPEAIPGPSCLDRHEWKKIIRAKQLPFLFVIVGLTNNWWFGMGHGNNILKINENSV